MILYLSMRTISHQLQRAAILDNNRGNTLYLRPPGSHTLLDRHLHATQMLWSNVVLFSVRQEGKIDLPTSRLSANWKRQRPTDSARQHIRDGWWKTMTRNISEASMLIALSLPRRSLTGRRGGHITGKKEDHLTNDFSTLPVNPEVNQPNPMPVPSNLNSFTAKHNPYWLLYYLELLTSESTTC